MNKNKRYIYITVAAFFIYAMVYSFLMVDDSYYNLEGDAANVGSWVYRDLCKDEFKNDPLLLYDKTFYLPSHLSVLKLFFYFTGSFIFSLKLLLFFQVFLTLCSTAYALRKFFPEADYIKTILLASFIALVYVKIPQIENVGFYGLKTATARSSFGIFLPLLILYYYKGNDLLLGRLKIPNILCVSVLTAIITNLHPQTGIMLFAVIMVHYFISIPKTKSNIKKILFVALISTPFIVLFLSLATNRIYGKTLYGYIYSIIEKFSWQYEKNFFVSHFFDFKSLWLTQITYLPYVFIVFFLFLRRDVLPKDKRFIFLKNMFLVGFFIYVVLGGMGYNFYFFFKFSFAQIFMRGSRIVFFLMEFLAGYFILRGMEFIKSRKMHLCLSSGILFCLFMMSDSRLEINSDFLDVLPFFKNLSQIQETLSLRVLSIFGLSAFIILVNKRFVKSYFLGVYCAVLLFIWPLICGTLKMKMGEIMDCSYGLGSWKLASRFINSSNVYEIDQYEELINWTKENTKENEFFYTFLPDFLGQKLKLATLRPGVGDISDVGLNCKNGKFIASKIRATYSELFSESEKTNNLDEVIEKYSVDYIVADKALCGDSLRKFSKYPQLFSNDKYIVLKVETK